MQISLPYNQKDTPLYYGGHSEVWKSQHEGREVAVKVLRVYQTSNFNKVRRVSRGYDYPKSVLPAECHVPEILQRSLNVESTVSPEHTSAVGSHDGRTPVCNDIGMDGQRKHQHLCQSPQGRKSF